MHEAHYTLHTSASISGVYTRQLHTIHDTVMCVLINVILNQALSIAYFHVLM